MNKYSPIILAGLLSMGMSGCMPSVNNTNNSTSQTQYIYKNQSLTLTTPPNRVITLSTPLLNLAYAVGGTSISRPTTSTTIPDAAKDLPELGQVSQTNMETLISLKPDLVIGEQRQNRKAESLLKGNQIPYILVDYDGISDNVPLMTFLSEVYGTQNKAKEVIATYEKSIQSIQENATKLPKPRIAILRATGKDVTAETPLSVCASMAELLYMHNVITEHKEINLETKTVPYSLEQLSTDDPDIIFVVTMGNAKEISKKLDEEMRTNPAWNHLQAIQKGKIYYLPPELFLMNPGIRTPEALNQLLELSQK